MPYSFSQERIRTSARTLLTSFTFSCRESGIKEPHLIAVLPEVHKLLVKKMVHTYGNELVENNQLLRKKGEPVLEVPAINVPRLPCFSWLKTVSMALPLALRGRM